MKREIFDRRRALAFCAAGLWLQLGVACEQPTPPSSEPQEGAAASQKVSAKEKAELIAARVKALKQQAEQARQAAAPDPADCPKAGLGFSDKDLEAELRKKLGKPEGDLSEAEVAKVRSVNLASSRVDYLDPCIVPKLTGLRHLYLGPGKLSDLTPLKGLIQLTGLRASMNSVVDISPLANLVRLDQLDLGRTQVTDLSPLRGMNQLTELSLDGTPIRNIEPLAGLSKLERLSLKNTQVKDIAPLRGLRHLKFLYLGGAPVDNPFALRGLMKAGLKVDTKP